MEESHYMFDRVLENLEHQKEIHSVINSFKKELIEKDNKEILYCMYAGNVHTSNYIDVLKIFDKERKIYKGSSYEELKDQLPEGIFLLSSLIFYGNNILSYSNTLDSVLVINKKEVSKNIKIHYSPSREPFSIEEGRKMGAEVKIISTDIEEMSFNMDKWPSEALRLRLCYDSHTRSPKSTPLNYDSSKNEFIKHLIKTRKINLRPSERQSRKISKEKKRLLHTEVLEQDCDAPMYVTETVDTETQTSPAFTFTNS